MDEKLHGTVTYEFQVSEATDKKDLDLAIAVREDQM